MAYNFDNPYEWLEYHTEEMVGIGDLMGLRRDLLEFAKRAGFDQIQDIYEHDMSRDGYFDELDGTSGQDRESYSDDQDRDFYTVDDDQDAEDD